MGAARALLKTHAPYFVPAGTPREEWPQPPVVQPRPVEASEPAPVMVATHSFAVPGGHAIVMVARGDRFRVTHQLVRLFPDRFELERRDGA